MSFKVRDHYFDKAKKDQYLARSAYKLEEIQKKYKILSKADSVLDLGYFPGSWIQYSSKVVGPTGSIVGIDIQEVTRALDKLENVRVYQKDVNEIKDLAELGVNDKFNVLLSDMAPSTSGIKSVDQARSLNLVEMVFYHLPNFLKTDGNFAIKVFDSNDAQTFLKNQRSLFKEYNFLKPKSTRSVSKEFFVIGKGFKA